jgi:hypothetical protein
MIVGTVKNEKNECLCFITVCVHFDRFFHLSYFTSHTLPLFVSVCLHVHTHLVVYMCTLNSLFTCAHSSRRVRMHIYIHVWWCACTWTCARAWVCGHTWMYTCICVCYLRVHVYTYVFITYSHSHSHTHLLSYSHTLTLTLTLSSSSLPELCPVLTPLLYAFLLLNLA